MYVEKYENENENDLYITMTRCTRYNIMGYSLSVTYGSLALTP